MQLDHTERDCVTRGAALLDKVRPGWHHEIKVGTLDLADSCRCVLGQIYGCYHVGMDTVFAELDDIVNHERHAHAKRAKSDHYGFSVYATAPCLDGPIPRAAWDLLTAAWREEITTRRLAPYANTLAPQDADQGAHVRA